MVDLRANSQIWLRCEYKMLAEEDRESTQGTWYHKFLVVIEEKSFDDNNKTATVADVRSGVTSEAIWIKVCYAL
jgi:hypothetical protein